MAARSEESTGRLGKTDDALGRLFDRFDEAWQQGLEPRIEDYLPSGEPNARVLAGLAHIDSLQALGIEAIATCHGPAIRGTLVDEVLTRIRELPAMPALDEPGQGDLDQLIEMVMSQHAAAANGAGPAARGAAEPAAV